MPRYDVQLQLPLLPKFIFAFGALQMINDRGYSWAPPRNKSVPSRALAIFVTVAIVVGLVLPAPADELPNDPFGNHTAELNKDAPLVGIWESPRDKMQLEKAYFHECLDFQGAALPINTTARSKAR